MAVSPSFDGLLGAMKRAAAMLRDEGIEFALAGGLAERPREVVLPVGLAVVVAEHGDDRYPEVAARVGDDARLVHLPVLGQVAGEQDQIGLLLDAGKRLANAIVLDDARVDVAGGRDPDGLPHAAVPSR